MNLYDRVTYIGGDPQKQNRGVGMIIDLRPNPLRPNEVTVSWSTFTPTTENRDDLSPVSSGGAGNTGFMPTIGGDWLKTWIP